MANELSNLKPRPGAHKKAKRIGRGFASGDGKTSGRGQKGQRARSKVAIWFDYTVVWPNVGLPTFSPKSTQQYVWTK